MIEFTNRQKKTIATGLTAFATIVVLAVVVGVCWLVLKALALASSALVPVILGFFLALFFKPYYSWWKKTAHNPTLALVAMLATILVPLGLLVWYAGAVVVSEISNLIAQGPELFVQVTEWFRATFPKLHNLLMQMGVPYDDLGDLYTKYGATALKAGSSAVKCLMGAVSVLVTLLFFIFFLMADGDRKGSDVVSQFAFLKSGTKDFVSKQVDTFVEILVSFFQRQIVICLIEGIMYGVGFWVVGLPYGFLIGFALGVLNLIPFFGTLVCLPVALPLAYFHQGSVTRLVLVLLVWLTGQFLDGYLITPRIQGNKTGLGYAGVIFSFFFWSTVLGPMLGMLLAIPLSAFCVVLWRALKSKYIQPVV